MNRILQADVILTLTEGQAGYVLAALRGASQDSLHTVEYRESFALVQSIVSQQCEAQGFEL
jgi:hypothetical protein